MSAGDDRETTNRSGSNNFFQARYNKSLDDAEKSQLMDFNPHINSKNASQNISAVVLYLKLTTA